MRESRLRLLPTIFGVVLATAFLILTFRRIDLSEVWAQIQRAGFLGALALLGLCWSGIIARGCRWWSVLPRPTRRGEWALSLRALALGYGLNQVLPRAGEITRVIALSKDTRRDLGSVLSTAALDRFVFDFLVFVPFYALALHGSRDQVIAAFPELTHVFSLFLGLTGAGILGLFLLGFKPAFFRRLLLITGTTRIPWLGARLDSLTEQLSSGLAIFANPKAWLGPWLINAVVWALSLTYVWVSLALFHIDCNFAELALVFAIGSLGLILPSPGGVGTVHYFLTIALTQFLNVEAATAVAAATLSHGISYFGTALFAVLLLFWKPKSPVAQGDDQ